jgi:hypothetical protein
MRPNPPHSCAPPDSELSTLSAWLKVSRVAEMWRQSSITMATVRSMAANVVRTVSSDVRLNCSPSATSPFSVESAILRSSVEGVCIIVISK